MSDRPAPVTEAEHRLLSHFLSPGTRVTERTMAAVHAYRDEVLREVAASGAEERLDVSAHTDEDGVLHVAVRDGGRVYELQGRPVVEIQETQFPVDEWSRVRFVLSMPDAKQVTARMEPAAREAGAAEHPAVVFLRQALDQAESLVSAALAGAGAPWPVVDSLMVSGPGAVLRRIAAVRQILAEHANDYGDCAACGRPSEETNSRGHAFFTEVEWPCRTVRLLAEAWGWTEDDS